MASDSFICALFTCQVQVSPSTQSPLHSNTLAPCPVSLPHDLGNDLLQGDGGHGVYCMSKRLETKQCYCSSIILHSHNAVESFILAFGAFCESYCRLPTQFKFQSSLGIRVTVDPELILGIQCMT